MKAVTLHPVSVIVGGALVASSLVLSGAAQIPSAAQRIASPQARVVGEIPAEWWTYVVLSPTTPSYTVPLDRRLVVVASFSNSRLDYDGITVDDNSPGFRLAITNADPNSKFDTNLAAPLRANEARAVFQAGSTLSLPGGVLKLWGYLEPL